MVNRKISNPSFSKVRMHHGNPANEINQRTALCFVRPANSATKVKDDGGSKESGMYIGSETDVDNETYVDCEMHVDNGVNRTGWRGIN